LGGGRLNSNPPFGVLTEEIINPGHQPFTRKTGGGKDGQGQFRSIADNFFGCLREPAQGVMNATLICLSGFVQRETAAIAIEQEDVQNSFKIGDLMADRRGCDAQLFRRSLETTQTRRRFEYTK